MFKKIVLSLALMLGFGGIATQAFAGTDLTVTCSNIGVCSISPANTPLFEEANWLPGSEATQYFRMSNTSSQNGFAAIEVVNYRDEVNNLGAIVEVNIHEGSPDGNIVYGGVTLHEFRDDGYFTFDALSAGQTMDYYVTLTMPATAGNEYQGAGVLFDLNMGLELEALPPDSGGGDGGGGDSGGGSASPPVCNAEAPTSAPVLTVSNPTANTVNLNWTAVSPVTHYALIFTRNSDGEQYGSTNIGNTTSYTVTNLSGGQSYSFEVFGVNDCAPGPRSTLATTGTITGAALAADIRPLGPGGEVLGVEDEEALGDLLDEDAEGEVAGESDEGEVLGASSCYDWKFYIPWIILAIQALVILIVDFVFRNTRGLNKHILAVVATIASIVIYYLIRECNCYVDSSFLAWLCKWYWIVSILLTGLLTVFNYAFIENVEDDTIVDKPSD